METIKIVFFGSSPYCLVTLKALIADARYRLVAVVTQVAKPVGRKQIVTPTAVEVWAREHNIEVIKPTGWKKYVSEEERSRLRELGAEVGVLSNYGKILPKSVIDIFPKGIVNIHPSLLPKHRGPAPAVGAILSGDTISGTSIMLLGAEMDAGPVIGAVTFQLQKNETQSTYYEKGFRLGTEKLLELLPAYLAGEIVPSEQDHTLATFTKMLSREDGEINWSEPAELIERKVRAYTPWPGSWTMVLRDQNNLIHLPKLMAEKIGLVTVSQYSESDKLTPLRMKILGVSLVDDRLRINIAQLDGDVAKEFGELRLA